MNAGFLALEKLFSFKMSGIDLKIFPNSVLVCFGFIANFEMGFL